MNTDRSTDSTTQPAEQITRFQCRHIHHTGHRCGSPCLRNEEFCYHHHINRKPVPKGEAQERIRARKAAFTLPRPEDRSAIQAAIGEVILRLAANELNPRRAGLLLYGLQIASVNLPPRQPAADPANTVEEVVEHPELGLIATPADFEKREKRGKTLEDLLKEAWASQPEPPDPEPTGAAHPDAYADHHSNADDHTIDIQAVAHPARVPHPRYGKAVAGCAIEPTAPQHLHKAAKCHRQPHVRVPHPLQSHRKGWGLEPSARPHLNLNLPQTPPCPIHRGFNAIRGPRRAFLARWG